MASTLAEADAMIQVASERGTILAVGHSERYNPAVTAAMPLVTEPRFVEVHRLAAFPARGLDVDVVFDVMIHDLDVLLAIVKAEPVSVEAVGVPVLTDRIDIANARLRFGNGCIANLTASRISRDRVRKLRFFQHHALVTVDCATQQVEAFRVTRSPDGEPAIEGGPVSVPDGEPLELELRDFLNAVRGGEPPLVDGAAGRRALALAERIAGAMLERDDRPGGHDHAAGGPDVRRATRNGLVSEVDQLVESRDLIGLGAAADARRRQKHDDRVTFVRVQEVPALVTADVELLPGAGELRIASDPETGQEAVAVTRHMVAVSGSIPVTGFMLDSLATLCGHDAGELRRLLGDLRGAGLAMVSALHADAPRRANGLT